MSLFKNSFQIIKRFFPDKPMPLGRWSLSYGHLSEIKGTLANIDSCADNKCGDPYTTRIAIDKIRIDSIDDIKNSIK
tara:strand:- start:73 stop:303 length:231 start_codon:yes stop_codon:yes gene_type:complete